MQALVVGVGDCRLSCEPDSYLVTYGLGSCIGVTIYDPITRVGGMLHYMLPDSSIDIEKARDRPFMFADTGIPQLFQKAYRLGADKSRLRVAAVGGAQVLGSNDAFHIGKRNHLAMRKILWSAGVLVDVEDIGGSDFRTIRLEIATGRLLVRGADGVEENLHHRDSGAIRRRGAAEWTY